MVSSEVWIALFLLLTAVAYLISYILYTQRTAQVEPQFLYVAIFSLIAGIFFVIYASLNYYHVAYGKGSAHLDYLDRNTNQGRYASSQPSSSQVETTSSPLVVSSNPMILSSTPSSVPSSVPLSVPSSIPVSSSSTVQTIPINSVSSLNSPGIVMTFPLTT